MNPNKAQLVCQLTCFSQTRVFLVLGQLFQLLLWGEAPGMIAAQCVLILHCPSQAQDQAGTPGLLHPVLQLAKAGLYVVLAATQAMTHATPADFLTAPPAGVSLILRAAHCLCRCCGCHTRQSCHHTSSGS